ncbi:DMT family transporter [Candidatus Bathyarchaeota archaeon]|nr:DMT family transporter [Candidatus Bathyarchaeota archaeon]
MSGKQRGILFAVSASFMFGLSPVFVRLTLDFVNVETMNVLFTAFASLCFVALFAAFQRAHFRSILGNWRKVALMSLLSAAGSMLFTYGISLYGPVNAAFLIQFTAVFTILFGVAFFKERFTRLEAAGILLAVAGVFVLAYGDLSLEIVGTAVLLSAALLFASANSLSKVYVEKVNPVALAGGNSMFMFLFIFAYAVLAGRLETAFPSVTLVYAVLGSVTGVVLSFILFFKALKVFEVSKAATIRTIEPFLTAIFSFAILASAPTANQLLGGALIVVGVVVLSLTKAK